MKIKDFPENTNNVQQLLSRKNSLVPLLGAGFSRLACPTWADFLEGYFQHVREKFFLPADEAQYWN